MRRSLLATDYCLLSTKKISRAKQRGTSGLEVGDATEAPSCLAVYFTWPQVALTHHVLRVLKHPRPPVSRTLRRRLTQDSHGRLEWNCPRGCGCVNFPAGSYVFEPSPQHATRNLPRLIRPRDERPPRHHRARLQALRRDNHRILVNPEKKALFTVEERRGILEEVLTLVESDDCLLRVDSFEGLLMRYAVEQHADAVVRGIRAISDYEYELQMALMNRRQEPRIETVFMMAAEAYSYVSSRLVKEVYSLGGTIEGLVPATVEERMRKKFGRS